MLSARTEKSGQPHDIVSDGYISSRERSQLILAQQTIDGADIIVVARWISGLAARAPPTAACQVVDLSRALPVALADWIVD